MHTPVYIHPYNAFWQTNKDEMYETNYPIPNINNAPITIWESVIIPSNT